MKALVQKDTHICSLIGEDILIEALASILPVYDVVNINSNIGSSSLTAESGNRYTASSFESNGKEIYYFNINHVTKNVSNHQFLEDFKKE